MEMVGPDPSPVSVLRVGWIAELDTHTHSHQEQLCQPCAPLLGYPVQGIPPRKKG